MDFAGSRQLSMCLVGMTKFRTYMGFFSPLRGERRTAKTVFSTTPPLSSRPTYTIADLFPLLHHMPKVLKKCEDTTDMRLTCFMNVLFENLLSIRR